MRSLLLAVLLLVSYSVVRAADEPMVARPNILFILADDQRADTIAALGNTIIKTPNLDRLVHRGVTFNRAYMQGGFTGATCVPSRAMLMTGRSLFHIGGKPGRDETWPAAFGQAGYTTFVTGKWHNGNKMLEASFQSGRSLFCKGMSRDPLNDSVGDLVNGKLSADHPAGKHLCASFADQAIQFLGQQKSGPFFCYLAFDGPHDPHIVPKDFAVQYDASRMPLPPNFLPDHPFNNGEMSIRDEQLLPHPRTSQDVRAMLADYYRYISYLDMLIGQVLDTLDASPYAKNTIIVFSADSGVARGSHGLIGKQNLYEYDSVRVPLIVAGLGIPADKRTDAMCYLYDLLPTLGGMCQVKAPAKSDGLNFSEVLRDAGRPGRSEMVFAYKGVQRAIATKEWKLIQYPKVNRTQLFNLKEDPYEIHDLAADPKQADRVKELSALLKKKLAEAGDTQPERNDDKSPEK